MIRLLPLAAAALALAACDGHDGNSTSISFSSNDSDGNSVTGGIDKDGNLKVDSTGFKADIKLPSIKLDAGDFEMNGVHLYPGSAITSMNIDAHDKKGEEGKNDGKVSVAFTSPATAATVRDWLKERLDKAGFVLSTAGNGLTGKTDDGQPFVLKLDEDGAGKSKGSIEMGS